MTVRISKKTKIILMLILLLSSFFALGCSTHGKGDEIIVRYEFCPGKYYTTASVQEAYNMFYYAVNQSEIQGSAVYDTHNNAISGSRFTNPVNISDDNNGSWIADGFYTDINNRYGVGTYTLRFIVKSLNYSKEKYMSWDDFPNWQRTPIFDTSAVNDAGHRITVTHSGISRTGASSQYTVRYRVKLYVYDASTSSTLFGQSASSNDAGDITYSLPTTASSYQLVPVLVAELHNGGQIQKILYYPGERFTYNP